MKNMRGTILFNMNQLYENISKNLDKYELSEGIFSSILLGINGVIYIELNKPIVSY